MRLLPTAVSGVVVVSSILGAPALAGVPVAQMKPPAILIGASPLRASPSTPKHHLTLPIEAPVIQITLPTPKLPADSVIAPVAPITITAPPRRTGSSSRNDYFINLQTIRQIICTEGDGVASGTGSIVSRNRIVTAYHVVHGAQSCSVDGKPAKIVFTDATHDMAVIQVELGDTPLMPFSCDGFSKLRGHFGIGFSKGEDFAMVKLVPTGDAEGMPASEELPIAVLPMAVMLGESYPGMSGGPVVDLEGRMVGLVNAGDDYVTLSRPISETALCAAYGNGLITSTKAPTLDELIAQAAKASGKHKKKGA